LRNVVIRRAVCGLRQLPILSTGYGGGSTRGRVAVYVGGTTVVGTRGNGGTRSREPVGRYGMYDPDYQSYLGYALAS
jgi:hypothetical protein